MLSLPPLIVIFFSLNLFMSLCNHPLLVVNVLVSLISGDPLLKSVWAQCFLEKQVAVSWATFLFISSTHKCNAFFSMLTKHLPCMVALAFALMTKSYDSKTSTNFIFLHNFVDKFVSMLGHSNLSV